MNELRALGGVGVAALFLTATFSSLPAVAAHGEAEQAREILRQTGVKGGLIVHVGCGEGALTAALGAGGPYVVRGLDADAANIEKAREHIRSLKLGATASVGLRDGPRLPFADNFVNLLVAEDLGGVSMAEVLRVLRPLGVALVKGKMTVKPWPAEMDEWTHWLHGPGGNAVGRDKLVGPPRRFQWIAKPLWARHHHTAPSLTAMVSARGRLFYVADEAPASMDDSAPDKWVLVARDAFNGIELWRTDMPQWGWKAWSATYICRFTVPTHMTRRLVAVGDTVYVTLGFNAPLTELDAATGKVLRTFEAARFTDEVLCRDGLLIVALNKEAQRPSPRVEKGLTPPPDPPVRKSVAAIDAVSGKMLWKVGDYVGLQSKTGSMDRINHLSMVAGPEAVFFVDANEIVSLDLKTGRETWRIARPAVPEHKMRYDIRLTDMCTLVVQDGIVFFAQLNPDKRIGWREVRGKIHAFAAETGKQLWSRQCSSWGWGHPIDVFAVGGLVWVHDFQNDFILGLDPKTGELKRKISNHEAFDNGHHHRCYRNKATERFMITSYRGLEFIDWASGQTNLNHWVRSACRVGAMPCNGMIYTAPHPCECYISSKLNGFLALAPAFTKASAGEPDGEAHPLQKGPAFAANPQSPIRPSAGSGPDGNPDEWPTYRHDPGRAGSTVSAVAGMLKVAWQADVGSRPTSPVIAGGRLVVASQTTGEVLALDAESGKPLWRFAAAGGGVDTPPTIHRGRAIFGCSDGWVYCLDASDGRLAWRFRAAPDERIVGAFGSLESAWPVHGSVLVEDDTVYCTAGRSSFLDGGIYAFALDAATGRVRSRQDLRGDHAAKVDTGRSQTADTGQLSDVLVSHAGAVYMRQRKLFGQVEPGREGKQLHVTSGMLDDSWFSRTRWSIEGLPVSEYLVFDATSVYGVRAREAMSGYTGMFAPGAEGYQLFAADRAPVLAEKKGKSVARRPKDRWSISIPVKATSMVLAGDVLHAAGCPDEIHPDDPWAAYEGRKGGRLLSISAADGKIVGKYKLTAPPVPDGLAAANGRLYVSQRDGRIVCMTTQSD